LASASLPATRNHEQYQASAAPAISSLVPVRRYSSRPRLHAPAAEGGERWSDVPLSVARVGFVDGGAQQRFEEFLR
jgi:hypothetical protein